MNTHVCLRISSRRAAQSFLVERALREERTRLALPGYVCVCGMGGRVCSQHRTFTSQDQVVMPLYVSRPKDLSR